VGTGAPFTQGRVEAACGSLTPHLLHLCVRENAFRHNLFPLIAKNKVRRDLMRFRRISPLSSVVCCPAKAAASCPHEEARNPVRRRHSLARGPFAGPRLTVALVSAWSGEMACRSACSTVDTTQRLGSLLLKVLVVRHLKHPECCMSMLLLAFHCVKIHLRTFPPTKLLRFFEVPSIPENSINFGAKTIQ
jgi:hypothetical protein